LAVGSTIVLYNSIPRLINPLPVNYDGMIILAIIGFVINFAATIITSHTKNKNEKAVSLHMLEDVLGWAAVLVGSLLIKYTGLYIIDAILSVGITIFILSNVIKQYKEIFNVFLEKVPKDINMDEFNDDIRNNLAAKGYDDKSINELTIHGDDDKISLSNRDVISGHTNVKLEDFDKRKYEQILKSENIIREYQMYCSF
jgi:cobalt-zinc-cadmium efflux system protein